MKLWVGRTPKGHVAIILAYRWRGRWGHIKRVLWYV